jgi:high-affinity nickel-transport protein
VGDLGDNFGTIGFAIVGIFVVAWVASLVVYRVRRYDEIDVRIVAEPASGGA